MRILCELRFEGRKGRLNYFNSIKQEIVIINIYINNNNIKSLKEEKKRKHI